MNKSQVWMLLLSIQTEDSDPLFYFWYMKYVWIVDVIMCLAELQSSPFIIFSNYRNHDLIRVIGDYVFLLNTMHQKATYLPYNSTGFFSKIIADYLSGASELHAFYQLSPTIDGIKAAIAARQNFDTPRNILVEVLQEQYVSITHTKKVARNIQLLSDKNTFTITTAHQPNIFTGPLYFIYKIMHAIKLADELGAQLPQYKFVPVYYMGSEDADLDELGFVNVGGQKLTWKTRQTGAVGRMKVDKALLKLIHAIHGQTGVLPYGKELTDLLHDVIPKEKRSSRQHSKW
jgi:hypothetical protein